MNIVNGILGNYMLICAVIAYVAAQVLKFLIGIIKERRFSIGLLIASGGMPSSHSSTVCALCVAAVKLHGVDSPYFAITLVLAAIVMYDAAGVRRAAGEQAKLINRIVADVWEGKTEYVQKNLKELIGHTPLQVLGGAVLGVAIPFIYA
jgi:Uncharacterized protein conserved in bacteria